jgi:hypothetical protein
VPFFPDLNTHPITSFMNDFDDLAAAGLQRGIKATSAVLKRVGTTGEAALTIVSGITDPELTMLTWSISFAPQRIKKPLLNHSNHRIHRLTIDTRHGIYIAPVHSHCMY